MSEMFKYVQLRHILSGVLLLLTTGQLMVDQMPDLMSPNTRCRSFSILRLGDMEFKASNQKFIIKHQNYVWKAPTCRENQPFVMAKTALPWHSGIIAIMFDSKVSKNNNIKEESFIRKKLLSRKDSLCNLKKNS